MEVPGVAIVGYGTVGQHVGQLFPSAALYDPARGLVDRASVNRCQFAFVCVPTPPLPDGACDTSLVEEAVAWIESATIILRSTVPPGTTATLAAKHGKQVIFQPEYGPGETPQHPYADPHAVDWVILGGPRAWTRPVAALYKRVFRSTLAVHQTDSTTAELTKYMENAFLATKVAFCNEFFDIAEGIGVDFDELRELWLLDPRVGRSHTWVYPDDRGFGGRCLPKDLKALLAATGRQTDPSADSVLAAVDRYNGRLRGQP